MNNMNRNTVLLWHHIGLLISPRQWTRRWKTEENTTTNSGTLSVNQYYASETLTSGWIPGFPWPPDSLCLPHSLRGSHSCSACHTPFSDWFPLLCLWSVCLNIWGLESDFTVEYLLTNTLFCRYESCGPLLLDFVIHCRNAKMQKYNWRLAEIRSKYFYIPHYCVSGSVDFLLRNNTRWPVFCLRKINIPRSNSSSPSLNIPIHMFVRFVAKSFRLGLVLQPCGI